MAIDTKKVLGYDGTEQLVTTVKNLLADKQPKGDYVVEDDVSAIVEEFGAVSYNAQALTPEQKIQALNNLGLEKAEFIDHGNGDVELVLGAKVGTILEPAEDDIPKVFFGSPLPQTKDDTIMSFRYVSKSKDIRGYCETKAQGSSSMSYPKKNQTVKLYKDAGCTEKLEVDFKGWGKQNKFCFKANWIDLTHARNIVTARLWGDVVRSRTNYSDIPELLRMSPNEGAIDGFPVKVYAGGIYQGRYTMNIPKDAWMANMDDELDNHCILCGESNADDRSLFRAAAVIDGTDWSDEVHDTVPASISTSWNATTSFVANSSDSEFEVGIGSRFDVDGLIDYYLFGLASCGLDAFGKNQLFMTYDGQKWFPTMYDMDSTWGLWWDGSCFIGTDYARSDFQDFKDGNGNLLYIRLESLFADAIKARWLELRNVALSVDNIINSFEKFTDIAAPHLVEEDYADTTANGSFAGIPSQFSNNIQQIRSYVVDRLVWCDAFINSLGQQVGTLIYSLDNTELDGTMYIDTGLTLKEYPEYTVLLDYTVNSHDYTNNVGGDTVDVFISYNNYYGQRGWIVRKHSDRWETQIIAGDTNPPAMNIHLATNSTSTVGKRFKVAIKKTANSELIAYSADAKPAGVVVNSSYSEDLMTASDTMLIGATYKDGVAYGYPNITVHSCKVYSENIIDSEITMFFNGE